MAIRIAQKMGLHRDGELLGLTPFDTEMRRRIWWQIIMVDIKFAALSGLSHFLLPYPWDTKIPQNINDADLYPGSTEPVLPREGPTEMVLVMLVYNMAKFILNSKGLPEMEAMFLGPKQIKGEGPESLQAQQEVFDRFFGLMDSMDTMLKDFEDKYCDATASPLHQLACKLRPMMSLKMKEMAFTMRQQPVLGAEPQNTKDNLFKLMVSQGEHGMEVHQVLAECGFLWFARMHFHEEVFAVMVAQLCQRLTGTLIDRAWRVIDKAYEYYPDMFHRKSTKQHPTLAVIVLKAWKMRERALLNMGMPFETPECIYILREIMSPSEGRSSESGSASGQGGGDASPSQTHVAADISISDPALNQFLDGYLDAAVVDFSMWGDMTLDTQQQSFGAMGGFGGIGPSDKW
jgi:hypothetical protein